MTLNIAAPLLSKGTDLRDEGFDSVAQLDLEYFLFGHVACCHGFMGILLFLSTRHGMHTSTSREVQTQAMHEQQAFTRRTWEVHTLVTISSRSCVAATESVRLVRLSTCAQDSSSVAMMPGATLQSAL